MRRLLQAQFPWLIALLCWAHQINLVVGDFLGVQRAVVNDINSAIEVIKWFNNHGVALELLRQEQALSFAGMSWALILPAFTRWTAHCQAVTRLLKVKNPMHIWWTRFEEHLLTCAGNKADLKVKARQIRDTVKDDHFWDRLERYIESCSLNSMVIIFSYISLLKDQGFTRTSRYCSKCYSGISHSTRPCFTYSRQPSPHLLNTEWAR